MIYNGQGPTSFKLGGGVRFFPQDVIDWVHSGDAAKATSELPTDRQKRPKNWAEPSRISWLYNN